MSKETKLITYPGPSGVAENHDFTVRARPAGGEWEQLFVYDVKVDMHQVRHASMAMFDCSGTIEIEVTKNEGTVNDMRDSSVVARCFLSRLTAIRLLLPLTARKSCRWK